MPDALFPDRWAAIRELREGALPTDERVARAAGIGAKTVARRAGAEKWRTLDFRFKRVAAAHRAMIELAARAAMGEELDPVDEEAERQALSFGAVVPATLPEPWPDEPPAARMARIGAVLTGHTETILRRVEAGQPLESRQIAALSSLVALSERIAAMTRERALEEDQARDEKVADAIHRINRRIVYLAQCEARRLVVELFGIPQSEVDAKLPAPVDRSGEPRRRKAAGRKKAAQDGN
jgi:hypothetical protein